MRLTRVSLYSSNLSEAISFSLRYADPEAQYIIRSILGLDAEEIIPKFYGTSLATKSRYYDFGLKARELVMRIVMNPNFRIDESYSDVRDELYRAIASTRTGLVVLHFLSGGTTVSRISGFVTKFEASYFVEVPEVQLTIKCDDPMFRAINPVVLDADDLPTANPVILADSLSTAPHGFKMRVEFTASVPSFHIQDKQTSPEWMFTITPATAFAARDVLTISSDFSNKAVYYEKWSSVSPLEPGQELTPEEQDLLAPVPILDRIAPTSIWPIMFPGANNFWFPEIASFKWLSLEWYAAYWGV